MITIKESVSLKEYTTFQIGGPALYFCHTKNENDLHEIFIFAKSRKLPLFVLGGGSNLLVSDHGFSGLVVKNEIKGIKFTDQGNDRVFVEVGSGEVLDDVIALTVFRNLSGLENLSGIPGTIGGAVVQNAGAYGVEMKDLLVSVRGLNSVNGKEFEFKNEECQFDYRQSLFKKNKKFVITAVVLGLSKKKVNHLDYAGLRNRLGDSEITGQKIREAVIKIRQEKLPDWHKVGTAGSFFRNPIITDEKYKELSLKYEGLPSFPVKSGLVKVPLAWILDNICHLKGYTIGHVGLYKNQPLVLVNNGAGTAKEIVDLSVYVKKIVFEKTGIKIDEEVESVNLK